jgi:hypothetical protein
MKKTVVLLPFFVASFLLSFVAKAQQPAHQVDSGNLVKFEGGIGVLPVSAGAGLEATAEVVTRNIVRGVQPAGQIWVISALGAIVKVDGRIRVDGRGLLLGGGDAIGFNGNANVFATLICEPVAPFIVHSTDTAGVPLAPNGDFRIDDVLVPPPPDECDSPVLLIRTVGGTDPWFAAGIPKLD